MQNIIGQWLQSLKHYIFMCLLFSSPERLPYSPLSIALSIFAYFVIGLLLVDANLGYGVICARIMLELAMLAAIACAGLKWKRKLPRLVQTYSALVGVNLVITAVSIPLSRALGDNPDAANKPLFYATLAVMIWNLAVLSLIFKRAFEISTHLSAMISFNYFVVSYFVIFGLFK